MKNLFIKGLLTPLLVTLLLCGCEPPEQVLQEEIGVKTERISPTSQETTLPVVTLNAYWFMEPGSTPGERGDPPKSQKEKEVRVENLAQLILTATKKTSPWIVALQEIGTEEDLKEIAQAIENISGDKLTPLFVKGRDTFTGQNTGILLNPKFGWKVRGQANRPSDLQKEVSKHTNVTLEKGEKSLTVTNVHLRVPRDPEASAAQEDQIRALLKHAVNQLARSPNLIILGDFNVPTPPGEQGALSILLNNVDMMDTSIFLPKEDQKTHQTINRMLDRIFISASILNGTDGLQETGELTVLFHNLSPKTATDHYPVTLFLREILE